MVSCFVIVVSVIVEIVCFDRSGTFCGVVSLASFFNPRSGDRYEKAKVAWCAGSTLYSGNRHRRGGQPEPGCVVTSDPRLPEAVEDRTRRVGS